jgi:hypothetical protein
MSHFAFQTLFNWIMFLLALDVITLRKPKAPQEQELSTNYDTKNVTLSPG